MFAESCPNRPMLIQVQIYEKHQSPQNVLDPIRSSPLSLALKNMEHVVSVRYSLGAN